MEGKRHLIHVKVPAQSNIEIYEKFGKRIYRVGGGMRVVREAWNRGPLVGKNGRYKRIARGSVSTDSEIR